MIKINKLSLDKWSHYKELRLDALKREPIAFLANYEEEVLRPDIEWKSHIETSHMSQNNLMLFAFDGETVVGMIGLLVHTHQKIRHHGTIVSFYVLPEYRGRGIGKLLLNSIIDQAKNYDFLKRLDLGVVAAQKGALNVYQSCGFKQIAVFEKEYFVNGIYYDSIIMHLWIK